jgi:outer membrane protein assembly factor BamB
MKENEFILLGLRHRVAAISKSDGREVWSTELPSGGFGSSTDFVTLLCEASRVFAYTGGELHCLDLANGRKLWTNKLPGYGYGIAGLCLPGGGSAPNPAAVAQRLAQESEDSSAATH